MKFWQIFLLCVALMCGGLAQAGKGMSSGSRSGGLSFSVRPSPAPAAPPRVAPAPAPAPKPTGIGAANTAPIKPVNMQPTSGQATGIGAAAAPPPKPASPLPPPTQQPTSPPPAAPSTGAGPTTYTPGPGYGRQITDGGSGFGAGTAAIIAATGLALGYGLAAANTPDQPAPQYQAPPAIVQYVQPPQATVPPVVTSPPPQPAPTAQPAPQQVVTTYSPIQPSPIHPQTQPQESNAMAITLFIFLLAISAFIAFIINRHYVAWKKNNQGDFNDFYTVIKQKIATPNYEKNDKLTITGGTYNISQEDHRKWINQFVTVQRAWFNRTDLAGLLSTNFHAQVMSSRHDGDLGEMPNYIGNGICCTVLESGRYTYVNYMFYNGEATEISQWRYIHIGDKVLVDGMTN